MNLVAFGKLVHGDELPDSLASGGLRLNFSPLGNHQNDFCFMQ